MLFQDLLNPITFNFDKNDKRDGIIYDIISVLVSSINDKRKSKQDEFFKEESHVKQHIYLLTKCFKYYDSIFKKCLDNLKSIDLI